MMQWLQGCQSYWDWAHQNLLAQTLHWMNAATPLLAAAMNQLRADQASQPGCQAASQKAHLHVPLLAIQ